MFISQKTKGFTAAEFLVIVAIIVLMVGMVLVGFNNSRSHARDQARIANIQRIEMGVAQFFQVCGFYPYQLNSWITCDALSASNQNTPTDKMLGDFIPDIDSFGFNQPTSDYLYVGLTYDTAATPTPWCATGYHIGVKLEEPTRLAESDSQFDSKSISSAHKCLTQAGGPVSSQITAVTGFPGTLYNTSPVYDRKVNY